MGWDCGGLERTDAGVAAEGFRALWNILGEGEVGGRPARVVTLPEQGAEAVDPEVGPNAPHPSVPPEGNRVVVSTIAEAAALAGVESPSIRQEGAAVRKITVVTQPLASFGEMRVVEAQYHWDGQFYTLTAIAGFLGGEEGDLEPAPIPIPELMIYSPPGEAVEGIEVVDLGGVEAVCAARTDGGGLTYTRCDWMMGDVRVSLTGPDLQSVIQLAGTTMNP